MPTVAVLGYGNLLRQDDAAGIRIAEAIGLHWGDRVTIRIAQQPLPEWTGLLSEVDVAFVVDATRAGRSRPRVRRLHASGDDPVPGSHRWGPRQLLQMTLAVYGRAPETYLVLVPAANLQFGEELSSSTSKAVEQALRLLDRLIAHALSDDVPRAPPPGVTGTQFPSDQRRRARVPA
jgi:hydrogenase maturation protease